jgi:hypothetical protein
MALDVLHADNEAAANARKSKPDVFSMSCESSTVCQPNV